MLEPLIIFPFSPLTQLDTSESACYKGHFLKIRMMPHYVQRCKAQGLGLTLSLTLFHSSRCAQSGPESWWLQWAFACRWTNQWWTCSGRTVTGSQNILGPPDGLRSKLHFRRNVKISRKNCSDVPKMRGRTVKEMEKRCRWGLEETKYNGSYSGSSMSIKNILRRHFSHTNRWTDWHA